MELKHAAHIWGNHELHCGPICGCEIITTDQLDTVAVYVNVTRSVSKTSAVTGHISHSHRIDVVALYLRGPTAVPASELHDRAYLWCSSECDVGTICGSVIVALNQLDTVEEHVEITGSIGKPCAIHSNSVGGYVEYVAACYGISGRSQGSSYG